MIQAFTVALDRLPSFSFTHLHAIYLFGNIFVYLQDMSMILDFATNWSQFYLSFFLFSVIIRIIRMYETYKYFNVVSVD